MWVWGKGTAIPSGSLVHPGRDQPESWISEKAEEENPPRAKFKESPGGHRRRDHLAWNHSSAKTSMTRSWGLV